MITIGITFSTNYFLVCVLEGSKAGATIKYKEKLTLPSVNTAEMTEWFETELNLILNRENPDSATYRLAISNVKNATVTKVYYGQAIYNLLCFKKNINIDHTSPASIVPSKFGLKKGANLYDFIDNALGSQSSPWDIKMKDTALMTFMLLD